MAKEFSFDLCKQIIQIVAKTGMLIGKANLLFESQLKKDLEEIQIPRNKQYLHDMMSVLINYQENEKRMLKCRDEFDKQISHHLKEKTEIRESFLQGS